MMAVAASSAVVTRDLAAHQPEQRGDHCDPYASDYRSDMGRLDRAEALLKMTPPVFAIHLLKCVPGGNLFVNLIAQHEKHSPDENHGPYQGFHGPVETNTVHNLKGAILKQFPMELQSPINPVFAKKQTPAE
jgi:hypothetical protein